MHKIKFRAKNMEGKWVYGDLIHGVSSKAGKMFILPVTHIYPKGCSDLNGWDVDPETVGQFTGLLDKNGKEIFEGDIIETIDTKNEPCRHIVKYDVEHGGYCQHLFQAEGITVEPFYAGQLSQRYITEQKKYVIGNIHYIDNKQ